MPLTLGMLAGHGGPPIVIGSLATNTTSTSASSLAVSCTVPSGTKRLVLMVACARNAFNIPNGATFGAAALTQNVNAQSDNGAGQFSSVAIYSLENPTAGTDTVTATFSGNVDVIGMCAICLDKSSGTAPLAGSDTSSTNRSSASVSIIATAPAIVFFGTCISRSGVSITQSGDIDLYSGGVSNGLFNFGYRTTAVAATVTQSVTTGASRALVEAGVAYY